MSLFKLELLTNVTSHASKRRIKNSLYLHKEVFFTFALRRTILIWASTIFFYALLKGLGHAILGNFSTDQMVIELTKIWK